MYLSDLNPHLRFATYLRYEMHYNQKAVRVTDCRLFYVTEGNAVLSIEGHDYQLIPGSLFYCHAGSLYTVSTPLGFSLIGLNFDLTQEHREYTQPFSPISDPNKWMTMPVFANKVQDSNFLSKHLFLKNAAYLHEQTKQIADDYSSADTSGQQMSSARLKLLLTDLHRIADKDVPEKINLVKAHIQNNFSKKITNQELAAMVGYHEYHLNRLFAKYTGMNLHQYLLRFRLNQASYLLLNTEQSLQAIATQTGFGDYAHFSHSFKQFYGYSPIQYRKQLREKI